MPDIGDIWDDEEDDEQVRRIARVPAPRMIDDDAPRQWLIRKDGYFYRPNFRGYTTAKHEAGRYTKADAEREASVEPWHMKAMHEDEWPDDPTSAKLSGIAAENAALKEQLAAAEQARAVAEANLELRSMSNEGLRQLIGEMIEGLEPSAIFADALDDETPDEIAIGIYAGGGMQFGPSGGMNVGHLRIARDIITRARGAAS